MRQVCSQPRIFPQRIIAFSSWLLLLLLGPAFSSDEIADGPAIDIISSNITSLRKNWELIKSLDASVYFLQETTLNKQGQNAMAKVIRKSSHSAIFGPPCGYKFSGAQTSISLWNAKSGGLAAVAKDPLPLKVIKSTSYPFDSGRCTHTWLPTGMGRRGIHVINCYGYVGAGPKNMRIFKLNEKFLASVFEYVASLGEVPWIVVGDLQTSLLLKVVLIFGSSLPPWKLNSSRALLRFWIVLTIVLLLVAVFLRFPPAKPRRQSQIPLILFLLERRPLDFLGPLERRGSSFAR